MVYLSFVRIDKYKVKKLAAISAVCTHYMLLIKKSKTIKKNLHLCQKCVLLWAVEAVSSCRIGLGKLVHSFDILST